MIDWTRQCAAVIPCFNEAAHIGRVVESVRLHLPRVLVVDDGSTDATSEAARRAGAEVIRSPSNAGKGAALRAGWKYLSDAGYEWAICLDGDGQHAAADIPKFFRCAEKSEARLIVGNRMAQARQMPVVRRLANQSMSRLLSKLSGVLLPDSQCGFRLAHLKTVLRLPLSANGFVFESEMLLSFLRAAERIEFVPVEVIYGRRASKICPVADTIRWLRWWAAQESVA